MTDTPTPPNWAEVPRTIVRWSLARVDGDTTDVAVGDRVTLQPTVGGIAVVDPLDTNPVSVILESRAYKIRGDGALVDDQGDMAAVLAVDDPRVATPGGRAVQWIARHERRHGAIRFPAAAGETVELSRWVAATAPEPTQRSWAEQLVDAAEDVTAGLAAAVGELNATLDERLATIDLDGYLPDPVERGTVDWANEIPEIVGYWSWINNKSEGGGRYGGAKETTYSATPHPDQPIWEIVDIDADGWFLHTSSPGWDADQSPIYAVEGLTGRTLDDLTGLQATLKIAPTVDSGFWFEVDPVFRTPDGKYFVAYMSQMGVDWSDYSPVYDPDLPGESVMIGLVFTMDSQLLDHQTRVAIDRWSVSRPGVFGDSVATGLGAIAVGHENTVSGPEATAVGTRNTVPGYRSAAVGHACTASGASSTAIGDYAKATGNAAVAAGRYTTASGPTAFAAGSGAEASGEAAAAFNSYTQAPGLASAAFGLRTKARREAELATGNLRVIHSMTPVGRSETWSDPGATTPTLTYPLFPGVSRIRATITAIVRGLNDPDIVAVWELDALVDVSADGSSVRWLGDTPPTAATYADAGATGRTIAYTLVTGATPVLQIKGAGGTTATRWAAHFTTTEFAQ